MSINLKNFSVCENIVVSFDGKISIINMFTEITASSLPAVHPKMAILVSIEGDIGTYSETIEIRDPGDNLIASTTGKVEIKGVGGNNFVANFFNINLEKEGQYWIKVIVDEKTITNKINHFFLVKKA